MADERRDTSALRDKLAEVDREIVERLDARARLSKGIAANLGADASIDVGEREWLEALLETSAGDMPRESLRAILGQIRAASRAIEQRAKVSYVGPEGSFCHEAALEHFGAASTLVPAAGVREALEEVIRGRATFAVFPFESSVDGLVQPSVSALADTELMMVGERVTRASYDLMARADLAEVEKVYATALGLAGCQRFLDAELPRASVIDVRSPVVAAELSREEVGAAALVPSWVGRAAGLESRRANVGDEPDLKVRHAIAAARPAMRTGNDVTCLLFSVDDAPGSLFGVLKHFAEKGVNLRKLQSRPPQGRWDYVFYVELSAHVTDRSLTTALEAMKRTTKYLKVLGSCPASGT
jgi:chorismate mutase / prephenate dehydratase